MVLLLWMNLAACAGPPTMLGTWDIVRWESGPKGGDLISADDAGFLDLRIDDTSYLLLRYDLDAAVPAFVPDVHPEVGTIVWQPYEEDESRVQFGEDGGYPWYFVIEEDEDRVLLHDDGAATGWVTRWTLEGG